MCLQVTGVQTCALPISVSLSLSLSVSQPLSLSGSQPLSLSVSQPLSLSASQSLSLSVSLPLSLSASQRLSLSANNNQEYLDQTLCEALVEMDMIDGPRVGFLESFTDRYPFSTHWLSKPLGLLTFIDASS